MKSEIDLEVENLKKAEHRAQLIVSNAAADLFEAEAAATMAKERAKVALDDLANIRRDLRIVQTQCAASGTER